MQENKLSFKELYDVSLKLTNDEVIGDVSFSAGEVVAKFDKIQIFCADELKSVVSSRGGFDNRALVNWEETREVSLVFDQGVFSRLQLALLSNSKMIEVEEPETVTIAKEESLETDQDGQITLAKAPIDGTLFIYNASTGQRITGWTRSDKVVTIGAVYLSVLVRYDYSYVGGAEFVRVGQRLINGYLSLEGKTKFKDDSIGSVVTGLVKIPRLKISSEMHLKLGQQAAPMSAIFKGVAIPVGTRGAKKIMDIIILNDDIDSDID